MAAFAQVVKEQTLSNLTNNFIPLMQRDSAASVDCIKTSSLTSSSTDGSTSAFLLKTVLNSEQSDIYDPNCVVDDLFEKLTFSEVLEELTAPDLVNKVKKETLPQRRSDATTPVAIIRTVEELLDSSSDLDLPSAPPSPTLIATPPPLPKTVPPPLVAKEPPAKPQSSTKVPQRTSFIAQPESPTKSGTPLSPQALESVLQSNKCASQKQGKVSPPATPLKFSPRKDRSKSLQNPIVLPILVSQPGGKAPHAELISSSPPHSPESPYPRKLTLILKSPQHPFVDPVIKRTPAGKPKSPTTGSPTSPVSLASPPLTPSKKSPPTTRRSYPKMTSKQNHVVTTRSIGVETPPDNSSLISMAPDTISSNHYERLIEELKCPGCASPMKPPIMMCATGHSICSECVKVLMLCPLCSAPFIELRSRNLEALCAKAHFRCPNASAGCTVRVQLDLLDWHEKQCMYKSMKCFMGRVWGGCNWTGREAQWKEHLESEHADKVFKTNESVFVWNMNGKIPPLAGYYVFQVYNEMFNFYQVYDRDRILFTMTITSAIRERKHCFAYEVEMFHEDNEALVLTQRFPVHSEYDKDILLDGTCVSVPIVDLSRLIGPTKTLHYRVRLHEVKTPNKSSAPTKPSRRHSLDFTQTNIQGSNLKSVPASAIVTRKPENKADECKTKAENQAEREKDTPSPGPPEDSESEVLSVEKTWGTPQMNFNRKYLKSSISKISTPSPSSSGSSVVSSMSEGRHVGETCEACTTKTRMRNMTSSLRKSFRSIKSDIIELKKPFSKKSPEKKESLIKK